MKPEHKIIEVAPKTWCISEYKLVNAFVAEGEDFAAVIDTACGIGDIGAVVKQLTDKPIKILLTHNHFDHCGGVFHFPGAEVYMHPADEGAMDGLKHLSPDGTFNGHRDFYIRSRGPVRCPEYAVEDLLALIPNPAPPSEFEWTAIDHGDVIDLGGRKLTVIHTPGHTDGGVCYLDPEARILFSGDTVNNSIILWRQPNNGTALIQQYHDTVAKLWAMEKDYDVLAIGHDGDIIPKDIVKDYLDLTEGLLDGSITGEYKETGFRKGDVASKGAAELWYQCDA